jgi:DNA-nicking Smr family endonuclease
VKRPLRAEELALWAHVTATIKPTHAPSAPGRPIDPPVAVRVSPPPRFGAAASGEPKLLEPRRQRRLARERDPIAARLDLHGLTQDEARAALNEFLLRAQAQGRREALVVTGRGAMGDGVLRRRAPEWLAEPQLRDVVAGVAEAHRRHGGDGAIYVALKRRARS